MSRPLGSAQKGKKHRRHSEDSESEEEVEAEAAVVHHPRSVPLTGLAHKRRKTEEEKLAETGWGMTEPIGDFSIGSNERSAKKKSGLANRDTRTERQRGGPKPVAVRPHYQPVRDKYGNKLWKGTRAGLSWFDNVETAMAGIDDGTCKIAKGGCTGSADAIDHVKDFATEQTTLAPRDICDGKHHWNVILLADAQALYNGGFDPDADFGDAKALTKLGKSFVWSCTHCNSSKGGKKGNDGGAAKWLKPCPGDDCDL
jgi:hypothetical protein